VDDWDCAVAALAMVTGNPYQELVAELRPRRVPGGGLTGRTVDEYLRRHGFRVEWRFRQDGGPWPPGPFAPRHLALVAEFFDADGSPGGHAVAMDWQGQVHDPNYALWRRLRDYPVVWAVAGVWPAGGRFRV
jgi:hypothetical protein